jgi:osmotically-inducible protein OsmY
MRKLHKGLVAASSLTVLLALGACGDRVDTANRGDNAESRTEQAANEVRKDAREAETSVMGAGKATMSKIDDAEIVTKVKSKFAADDQIKAHDINVDAKDGMVTLTGTVPSQAAKERAAELVRNTNDVKGLDNKLEVKAG